MPLATRRTIILGAAAFTALAFAGLGTLSLPTHAAETKIYAEDGIAIDGTDPVSYFKEGKPVAGSAEITHQWNGATWHFSSVENRDAFAANPAAFAPQYGGYCAFAVSEGTTAPTVPDAWKIVGGKLYLNLSTSIQKRWEKNFSERIVKADQIWPTLQN